MTLTKNFSALPPNDHQLEQEDDRVKDRKAANLLWQKYILNTRTIIHIYHTHNPLPSVKKYSHKLLKYDGLGKVTEI